MIRVIIVDDHTLFREGLKSILSGEKDIEIVDLVGTVAGAIESVERKRPDVVLMDFNLPDGTGAEASEKILSSYPQCKVIFLTMSEKDEDLITAVRSGAKGYLLKSMQPSKLGTAIRAVHDGESALSRSMTLRVMEELSRTRASEPEVDVRLSKLTGRELDVLRELALGKSNQEIATALFLAENTVKYHVHSMLGKLNMPDRKALATFARSCGLIKR
jgi:two-component system nitrate/nitrite response regulator NarL